RRRPRRGPCRAGRAAPRPFASRWTQDTPSAGMDDIRSGPVVRVPRRALTPALSLLALLGGERREVAQLVDEPGHVVRVGRGEALPQVQVGMVADGAALAGAIGH